MRIRAQLGPLLVASFLPASSAYADLARDLLRCSADKNGVTRLACYDGLAQKAGAQDPGRSSSKISKWDVRTETSRIDDSRNVIASLRAETEIRGWPSKVFMPVLQIRCKERKTEAYVVTGMSPTVEYGVDTATVTLRFDKDKAFKTRAGKSTDGEALFFEQPVALIKRMMNHETMLFEFIPFNSSSAITTFDLRGLSEAIKPLRDACKW
jgi:type VI secretion system protein VasI